jgi:hypothetical protein
VWWQVLLGTRRKPPSHTGREEMRQRMEINNMGNEKEQETPSDGAKISQKN